MARPETRRNVVISIGVMLLFFVGCLIWTKPKPVSWNDISRTAAIESSVEQGTWAIDTSPWLDFTRDKVSLNGHFYSGKMPLLSAVGAVWYSVLYKLGLSLTPDCATRARGCAYYWVTLLLIGAPASATVGLFYAWGRYLNLSAAIALLGTLTLGAGTMLLPYSLVLNHHLPSAASLFIAFFLLMTRAPRDARWMLGSGLFAGLALMCDPLSGLMATALFVISAVRYRVRSLYFLIGVLPALFATAWLDLQITGTLLPPYLTPSAYDYEGSTQATNPVGNISPDDPVQYAFKMLLGAQGLFAYNPTLWFALAGIVIVVWTRNHPIRFEAAAIGTAFVALALYLAFRTGNLGGVAYGERYFVNAIPNVMAFVFFAPPLAVTRFRPAFAALFAVALALSLFSSYQGARNPWAYVEPPFHLTRDAATGTLGVKWTVNINQIGFLKQ
ncbi:MAG TPA: hypothetical protein VFD70_19000 [Anaerolineae bacterium]|nr:hypothetical protein [Anaerolineae bacterium]